MLRFSNYRFPLVCKAGWEPVREGAWRRWAKIAILRAEDDLG